jgi:isoleucyl-tRNA synthetase
VRLDLTVTAELAAEGVVRDIVREVNGLRRDQGLDVSDRIRLVVDTHHHADVAAALRTHRDLLAGETLAVELVVLPEAGAPAHGGGHGPVEGHRVELPDGRAITVAIHVVADPGGR